MSTRPLLQRGATLVELIMVIIIFGVALTGIALVINIVTRSSSDPLVHKQALAVAESLLEEVELMPYTFCDPDDPAAATATSPAGCSAQIENIGPEASYAFQSANETRYGPSPFDNVNDYDGFSMDSGNGGIRDVTNAPIAALNSYSATITVAPQALGAIPAPESLLITVTVTGPDNIPVVLQGYRTRFAPNSLP
jgi:MSHA pilin protein MshD